MLQLGTPSDFEKGTASKQVLKIRPFVSIVSASAPRNPFSLASLWCVEETDGLAILAGLMFAVHAVASISPGQSVVKLTQVDDLELHEVEDPSKRCAGNNLNSFFVHYTTYHILPLSVLCKMLTSPVLHSLIISGFAYLTYLIFEFRDRAFGTTKRKDPLFKEVAGWPLLGQLPGSILEIARPWEAGTIMTLKLRPGFSITLPGARVIEISKPEWIEYVQKTNFENYVKGDMFQSLMADLFGKSILVTDGAAWKRSRLVTSRIFHINTFKIVVEPVVDQSMHEVLEVLQVAGDEGRDIDFCNLFNRFTLDLFAEMTFGTKLGLLEGNSALKDEGGEGYSYPEAFCDAFNFSQKHMDSRFDVAVVWQWIQKMNFRATKKMESSCHTIHDHAYTAIDEKMSKLSTGDLTADDTLQKDFLGLIMLSHLQKGHTLTRDELRDDSLSLLFAGRDATAQSLSWCFFHLLMNKDIITRIREEAAEILGEDSENVGRVTPDNYRLFTCAYASLLEAFRLHPAVPKNVKFAKANDKIPEGPMIEAGDCLTWSDWQLARDPEVWGPDCGQFIPDRWIDEMGNITHFGNFKFHSFNGGPRLCVGMNMAIYIEVKTIVETLQKFDLEFSQGWLENVPMSEEIPGVKTLYPTPQYQPSLTLPMKNPMMISATPRKL
ncbi:Cytochrome P450 52A3 [Puccinia graminis f. sp. tritici]|uniref:Cytochrome P450 52A3 n=1 Tax=Puccinia graminis f. sp. tritici TaxID=56615 RepID=A0A5B0MU49_PUCGR|nr:Cytochrome P450 52A3 [Puccinia graminis f. sp. tritici]